MVTNTLVAIGDEKARPLSLRTRTFGPKSARVAVAPRQTTVFGRIILSSASSHGRQAASSLGDGFL